MSASVVTTSSTSTTTSTTVVGRKTRRPPTCSFCKQSGHNRSYCRVKEIIDEKKEKFEEMMCHLQCFVVNDYHTHRWNYTPEIVESYTYDRDCGYDRRFFMVPEFTSLLEAHRDTPEVILPLLTNRIGCDIFKTEFEKEFLKKTYKKTSIDHYLLYIQSNRKFPLGEMVKYLKNTSIPNSPFEQSLCTVTSQPRLEKIDSIRDKVNHRITRDITSMRNSAHHLYNHKIGKVEERIAKLEAELAKEKEVLVHTIARRDEYLDSIEYNEQKLVREFNAVFRTEKPIQFKQTKLDTVEETECPICFEELGNGNNMVETNCNHRFCMNCVLNVTCPTKTLEKFPCPCCRTNITNLSGDIEQMTKAVEEYRYKHCVHETIGGLDQIQPAQVVPVEKTTNNDDIDIDSSIIDLTI
jgi:hypothetical protein